MEVGDEEGRRREDESEDGMATKEPESDSSGREEDEEDDGGDVFDESLSSLPRATLKKSESRSSLMRFAEVVAVSLCDACVLGRDIARLDLVPVLRLCLSLPLSCVDDSRRSSVSGLEATVSSLRATLSRTNEIGFELTLALHPPFCCCPF